MTGDHPDHPTGSWWDPAAVGIATHRAVMDRAARSRAVLLGEYHDSAEIHRWQLHVATALHLLQPRMAMGFEMFPRRVQPVLDAWVDGGLDVEAFLLKAEWSTVWGFEAEIYLPLFQFCRQFRIPMIALNCERGLVRRVGGEGWAAIAEADRDGLTPPAPATEAYCAYLRDLMGPDSKQTAPERFPGFVAAQQVWDRAFAENTAKALARRDIDLMVGIIGRGHLEFGHGTPHQLRDLGIPEVTVLLTAEGEDRRHLQPGIADAVFRLPGAA